MENQVMEKKKRKFNVVDLIFILLIVAVIVVVALKFVGGARQKTQSREFYVVLHSDDLPDTALSGFKVGDKVLDENEKVFGTITEFSTGDARIHGNNSEGLDVIGPREDFSSLDVTVKVSAVESDNFLTVSGKKYNNNASFTFICGKSKLWLRVSDITPVN